MNDKIEAARQTLAAMGFEERKVDAAIAVLSGQKKENLSPDINEPLLTPDKLCEKLHISITTLWRMQELPHIKAGGRKRYLWSEVQQFLRSSQQGRRRV